MYAFPCLDHPLRPDVLIPSTRYFCKKIKINIMGRMERVDIANIFSSYLINARIEKAKKLLLECGKEKMCSVAEEIGYGNNPQYFSQIFKKHTGMTPTDYMKKMHGTD